MTKGSRFMASILVGVLGVVCGCGSSSSSSPRSSVSSSVTAAVTDVQRYLDAVNALCDTLESNIIEVTNGGSLDISLKDFFAQLPAHMKLRDEFDRQLASIPVPPAAKDKAAALNAYIRYANELDARRLAAAKRGRAAYTAEIDMEIKTAANDPSIAARDAAGFNQSCNAR